MLGCHGTQFPISRMLYVLCVFFSLLSVYCGQLLQHDICLVVLFMCHFYSYYCTRERNNLQTGGRHDMPRPSPPSVGAEAEPTAAPADGNVAVGSHSQYVPTLTAAAAAA